MKQVTQKDVAKAANVSRSAVSLVLNDTARKQRLSEETIERIIAASEDLGYSKNIFASSLRLNKSNFIGVLGVTAHNPPRQIRQNLIARSLKDRKYNVLMEDVFWTDDRAKILLELAQFMPEGIVLGDIDSESVAEALSFLEKRGVAVVAVDSADTSKFDNVRTDRGLLGYIAARHLFEQGYEEIYYAMPFNPEKQARKKWLWYNLARFNGFKRAQKEFFGVTRPEKFILWESSKHGSDSYKEGYAIGRKFLREDIKCPVGIIAVNDHIAIGIIKALTEGGVRIPQDVGIVGSENLPESAFSAVPLSSMDFPVETIAKEVCDILFRRMSGEKGKKIRLDVAPKLVPRESSLRTPENDSETEKQFNSGARENEEVLSGSADIRFRETAEK